MTFMTVAYETELKAVGKDEERMTMYKIGQTVKKIGVFVISFH